MNEFSKNMVIGFYSDNEVINLAYQSFQTQMTKIPSEFQDVAFENTNTLFNLLSEINLTKLFVSITSSNSLFFRFSSWNSQYEFKFEIFNDYDCSDELDIESTLHLYENGKDLGSYFGSVTYLFNIVKKLVPANIFVYGFNKEFEKEIKTIYSGVPEYSVSQKVTSSFQFQPNYSNGLFKQPAFSQVG